MVNDKAPQSISIDSIIEESGCDPMRYKKLSEMTFDEAVIDGYRDVTGELVGATVHLPMWVRSEVSNANLATDISQGKLYTAMVDHGCTLMKEIVDDPMKRMVGVLETLETSDNTIIMHMMQEFTINVNGIKHGSRRTISIPKWCKSFIGKVGGRLRMDFSSVLRLSLYLSIDRYSKLLDRDKPMCAEEIIHFKKALVEYTSVCTALADMEMRKRHPLHSVTPDTGEITCLER